MPETAEVVQQTYRAIVTLESQRGTPIWPLVGSTPDATFQLAGEPGAQRGNKVQVRYTPLGTDWPKGRTAPVIGHENKSVTLFDWVQLDYAYYDGKVENETADQQEVNYDLKKRERLRIGGEWRHTWMRWAMNQLGGATYVNSVAEYKGSGHNKVIAIDAKHKLYAGTGNSSDADVAADADAIFDYVILDEAAKRLGSKAYVTWPMSPPKTPWGYLYPVFVDLTGYQDLRSSAGSEKFTQIELAKLQGGLAPGKSPLMKAVPVVYNNFLIIPTDFVPWGITGGNAIAKVRYAIICGAGAMFVVFGEGFAGSGGGGQDGGDHLGWSEHKIHEYVSLKAPTVAGLKRMIPHAANGDPLPGEETFSVFVIAYHTEQDTVVLA